MKGNTRCAIGNREHIPLLPSPFQKGMGQHRQGDVPVPADPQAHLTFTVQWLNETSILTLAGVPVRMARGPGYLVNTEPIHSDGRPMVKRTQAGGPDQLWVYTKSPVTPGYYAIYHTRRNLSRP